MRSVDVAVIGAGLAGASLACALRASELSVALVEGREPEAPPAQWDARVYAVSPGAAAFLDKTGVWPRLDRARMTPVHRMEIFGDDGGHLEFSAYACGVCELAWIVESGLMHRELWESAKRQANLTLLCPAEPEQLVVDAQGVRLRLAGGQEVAARVAVGADGANSWVRRQAGIGARTFDYGEMGVVANLACERAHGNTAFQWFRGDGVLAFLPLPGNRVSIVWSTLEAHAGELLALDPALFCAAVREASGARLGELEIVTAPQAFPLRLMRVEHPIAPRLALLGDAAHCIHPLSGHGINLGFGDAASLAGVLAAAAPADPGEAAVLRRYERARAEPVLAFQALTDALHRLFHARAAPLVLLRNLGLNLTGALPVVRNVLARQAMR
ncbi:MAG: ubiquinone biosynthesis protein UbiH [Rhodocyclales bacterium CG17_big_fil_post_rev_8_21_14_2_50_68_7]|nr:MAG: ubiquinone biosynthesis protein UbiH [Rhodocyclales bacterium CG17_big_fil_post_rev_8_21_14_2_50_68_7]